MPADGARAWGVLNAKRESIWKPAQSKWPTYQSSKGSLEEEEEGLTPTVSSSVVEVDVFNDLRHLPTR